MTKGQHVTKIDAWMGYYPAHDGQLEKRDRLVYELTTDSWASVRSHLGCSDDERLQHQMEVLGGDLLLVVTCPMAQPPHETCVMGYSMPSDAARNTRIRCSIEGHRLPAVRRIPPMKLMQIDAEITTLSVWGVARRALVLRVPPLGLIKEPKKITRRPEQMTVAAPAPAPATNVATAELTLRIDGEPFSATIPLRDALALFKKYGAE